MPIIPQSSPQSRSTSSPPSQRALKKRATSCNNKRSLSVVESIENFISDLEASVGKKKHPKSKHSQNIKKQNAPIYSDDLYDELELWLLRLDSLFESLTDKLNGTLEILKRRFFQVSAQHGHTSNLVPKSHSDDRVKELTAEIDQIFGENVIRFRSTAKPQKVSAPPKRMSANELRDELERLLKGNKT